GGFGSGRVRPATEGLLQGAGSGLMGLANRLGPMIFAQAFATFIAHREWHVPGAACLLSSALLVAGTSIVIRVTRAQRLAVDDEAALSRDGEPVERRPS